MAREAAAAAKVAPSVLAGFSRGRPHPSPDSGGQEQRNEISEVLPPRRLFVSNWRGAERLEELRELGITHVVCVNDQEEAHPGDLGYLVVRSVEDHDDERISPVFGRVRRFVEAAFDAGGGVLIHCAAGISRSTTVAIATIMSLERVSLRDALFAMHAARRVSWPNVGFFAQLVDHERALQQRGVLRGSRPSVLLEEYESWTSAGVAEVIKQISVCRVERTLSGNRDAGPEGEAEVEAAVAQAKRDALGGLAGDLEESSALDSLLDEDEGPGTWGAATRLVDTGRLGSGEGANPGTLRSFPSHASSRAPGPSSPSRGAALAAAIRQNRQDRASDRLAQLRKARQEQLSLQNIFAHAAKSTRPSAVGADAENAEHQKALQEAASLAALFGPQHSTAAHDDEDDDDVDRGAGDDPQSAHHPIISLTQPGARTLDHELAMDEQV